MVGSSYHALNFLVAREQVWPNPGFMEQLVLFELCDYMPSGHGLYLKWRAQIQRHTERVPKIP